MSKKSKEQRRNKSDTKQDREVESAFNKLKERDKRSQEDYQPKEKGGKK